MHLFISVWKYLLNYVSEPGGQQLIVTGDPTATRKFLESISDGTTDLANILASAENGNVLVQADGQQILIRTNPAAQAVLGTGESNTVRWVVVKITALLHERLMHQWVKPKNIYIN